MNAGARGFGVQAGLDLPPMAEPETYAYLGPAGTFTEMALRQVPEAAGREWVPVRNVPEAIRQVTDGKSIGAMIAIENSIEGGVTASQDALASVPGLRIRAEVVVPISFSLAVRGGLSLADVRTVAAHPVAYGQCRQWLDEHVPHHEHLPATSNVSSAEALTTENPVADAAITTPLIREHLDVEIAASGIHDHENARTRFVLVSLDQSLPERTGSDKTSLIVDLPEDRPGALLELLEQFSARGINLSMISSRPIPDSPGRYRFVLDLDGHFEDARVRDALLGVHRLSPRVVFLGSYPAAEAAAGSSDAVHGDERYRAAVQWLRSLVPDADPASIIPPSLG